MPGQVTYRAFISYSHADKKIASWLHRVLESYRVPPRLIGEKTPLGPVPERLTPIFRDREELSAAGSLTDAIQTALSNSISLIVICSPTAVQSRWVNEEIRLFKRLHGGERIFAVIVDGHPGGSGGDGDNECFPDALRFGVGPDGELTDEHADPIATDLRPSGDGHRLGKLKLISGLIGVRLDDLVQREAHRKQKRLAFITAASLAGMAGTSGLAIAANEARQEAQVQRAEADRQRIEADGLIEFMLTDLRKKLEPVGRLDVLRSVGDRALDYYARQKLDQLDGDSLGRRARAMLLVAEVGDLQGDTEAARRGFIEAARSTGELLERAPNDWQRVFDHAQSEFWLAYDAHNRGDNRAALPHFQAYRDLGLRMMQLAPDKTESQVELASAEVNLGVALVGERRLRDAIRSFERAADIFRKVRPQSRDIMLNLNQAYGHKASTLFALGDNRAALATRRQQLELLQQPSPQKMDREVQEAMATLQAQIGTTLLAQGNVDAAVAALDRAEANWRELVALDPDNSLWRGEQHATSMWSSIALAGSAPDAARRKLSKIIAEQRRLAAANPDWAHKANLLKMIGIDQALNGQASAVDERLVADAWSRRATLKADDRAALAAVLIGEGDRRRADNASLARNYWKRADALLSDDQPASWTLVQKARLDRRLGRKEGERRTDAQAFAGIFEDSGL